MFRVLRSQPVNYGLRGALGLVVVYASASYIDAYTNWKLYSSGDSPIGYLQACFFDLFHTEHGLELISWIPAVIAALLTGLVFGMIFAILFARRSTYRRYIIVGMLGWFLHFSVGSILLYSFNMGFYLGVKHTIYLLIAVSILSGSFLGLLFVIAKSEKQEPVRWLFVGAFAYPLLMYFYIRLLFKLEIVETPKMFVALMIMVAIYLGSVFLMAMKSEGMHKTPWMVITSAIGYPLMPYMARLIPWQLFPSVTFPNGMYYTDSVFWQFTFQMAIQQAVYAIPFGLLVGVALGFQKTSRSQQIPA